MKWKIERRTQNSRKYGRQKNEHRKQKIGRKNTIFKKIKIKIIKSVEEKSEVKQVVKKKKIRHLLYLVWHKASSMGHH